MSFLAELRLRVHFVQLLAIIVGVGVLSLVVVAIAIAIEHVWMCGCVDVWMCGCVDVWMCGCVDVWMCDATGTAMRFALSCCCDPVLCHILSFSLFLSPLLKFIKI